MSARHGGRADGRRRAVIEALTPELDGGRFAVKRCQGERLTVECDAFTDGHDRLGCVLRYRHQDGDWREIAMTPLVNDRWRAEFLLDEVGRYEYQVSAWVDRFISWRAEFARREEPADLELALREAESLLISTGKRARAKGSDRRRLRELAAVLVNSDRELSERRALALSEELAELVNRYPNRRRASLYPAKPLTVVVDDRRAGFSAWYELFPRSASPDQNRPGTLRDVIARLPYVAEMGFDVLYLPPLHPIGERYRKGKNNAVNAAPDDVGVPWAIGSRHGGHKALHPELGDLDDFRALVAAAAEHGLEVAMDLALQCAPDHPYVTEHPQWFRQRPDGSIQYAENPPKKYQDIYPLDFETDDWRALWEELKSIVDYWLAEGVRIFRVDNPHTKPFAFWEWLIGEVKGEHPEALFLAEAFTRPKVMHRLAKLGFSQSYTYFTWRNSKSELAEYFSELSDGPGREYFRPNFWPNTPDILHEFLQHGGAPAFRLRLVLAATASGNYGIYGPTFELVVNTPREPGSEEYLDSEKYQLRHWQLDQRHSLKPLIARINQIRRANPALQYRRLTLHATDNDQLLCYSRHSPDDSNIILVVVNLDYRWTQSGWTALNLHALGLHPEQPFRVADLLTGADYVWRGAYNYVELDPHHQPAHIFKLSTNLEGGERG